MSKTLNPSFENDAHWRRAQSRRLQDVAQWLIAHGLHDEAAQQRLQDLQARVRTDRLMVAFVGEFSRGKSELINALVFSGFGRRIMPASAGRTTMCPTEIAFDPGQPATLRLLPIETRLQDRALADWRDTPDAWHSVALDVDQPDQMAEVLAQVAEVRQVSRGEALAMGFGTADDTFHEAGEPGTDDLEAGFEVPRWRHALINVPHPMLRQGLVILDTPGLNAIGAEPELTVGLLGQAQAAVFVLGADTGVTLSDQAMWREHLCAALPDPEARLAVLNKIDTLWDGLLTPQAIQRQVQGQCAATAATLGIAAEQVLAVSAHKGLLARLQDDDDMLAASRLPVLEHALTHRLLARRRRLMATGVNLGLSALAGETAQQLHLRRRHLAEQLSELRGLQGKNAGVLAQVQMRLKREQAEFEQGSTRVYALQAVHRKMLKTLIEPLSSRRLRLEMSALARLLQQNGLKLGVKKVYGDTFDRLFAHFDGITAGCEELRGLLAAGFGQLNAEQGFALQLPAPPDMAAHRQTLMQLQNSHVQYLGLSMIWWLAQPGFSQRLVRALSSRLRTLQQTVQADLMLWSKSATSQLHEQLHQRRQHFERRIESVSRIGQAATSLQERIDEIERQDTELDALFRQIRLLTAPVALDSTPLA